MNVMSLILKYDMALIHSQSRGDKIDMDVGSLPLFPVTMYHRKHLCGLEVKPHGEFGSSAL